MDSNDIFTIDIDDDLLIQLDKLKLDSIPNDIFGFPEEISKNENNSKDEDAKSTENSLSSENRVTEISDDEEKCKSSTASDKPCSPAIKTDVHSRTQKRKKDIIINEEPTSGENLHNLFEGFTLSDDLNADDLDSDSDNESNENSSQSKLKERAPIRQRRQANRNRNQNNILSRNENHDRSMFNDESLLHLSGGSNQIFFAITSTPSQFPASNAADVFSFSANEIVSTSTNRDSFYEDCRAHAVSSPESGYDSSSTHSVTGSPPRVSFPTTLTLDFIPETTVDDQILDDFLVANSAECALEEPNLSLGDNKDEKSKINDILNFLKDTPSELNESIRIPVELLTSTSTPVEVNNLASASIESNVATSLENVNVCVPLVNKAPNFNTLSAPLPSKAISKNVETPKKIVYKIDDKAKKALREFLSDEEFFAAKKRIYQKIEKDKVKVIYVEDEADKSSEKRTNLHYAVLNSKIEDIYCLIEIHKQYGQPLKDINNRDKYGKTALDYAIKNQMTLVVDYLKENTACESVNV